LPRRTRLRRQQAGGVDLARGGRPKEDRDLAVVAQGLVDEHAHAGDAEAAGDQQQVPAPGIDLERPAERPEHVHRVTGPQPREPLGPASHYPEVDRHHPGHGIGRVDRERPPQDQPGVVPGAHVHELPGREPAASGARGMPGATGRAGSPGSRQARPIRGACSRALVALLVVLAFALAFLVAFLLAGLTGCLGERLGDRVRQVAEDVGRVVELDQVVGRGERSPLPLGVLGDDLGPDPPVVPSVTRSSSSSTTISSPSRNVKGAAEPWKSSNSRASVRWLRSTYARARSYSPRAASSRVAGGPPISTSRGPPTSVTVSSGEIPATG